MSERALQLIHPWNLKRKYLHKSLQWRVKNKIYSQKFNSSPLKREQSYKRPSYHIPVSFFEKLFFDLLSINYQSTLTVRPTVTDTITWIQESQHWHRQKYRDSKSFKWCFPGIICGPLENAEVTRDKHMMAVKTFFEMLHLPSSSASFLSLASSLLHFSFFSSPSSFSLLISSLFSL